MYLTLDQIKLVQIDHTSRCNLACPQCARTVDGKENPILKDIKRDLTVVDYETILQPFVGQNVSILHCGNYGDAISSPTFDETYDYTRSLGFDKIDIMTNGSLRNPEWWQNFAKRNPVRSMVIFSIDGLEDTNHIYRVNSNFKKIKENAAAFINAGGKARWDYLIFDHNRHQVEEAKALARELGFVEFNMKNTSRFVTPEGIKDTVKTKTGIVKMEDGNRNVKDYDEIVSRFGNFNNYAQQTPVTCKYKNNNMVYVDFEMRLWPCCWIGAPKNFYQDNIQKKQMTEIFNRYGTNFNRLDLHGWDACISHEFFSSYLSKSWDLSDDKFPRLHTCGRTCGDKFEFTSGSGKNSQITALS
jgi:sulfatase maturation enzyme AslB (radical SAM superfamily)